MRPEPVVGGAATLRNPHRVALLAGAALAAALAIAVGAAIALAGFGTATPSQFGTAELTNPQGVAVDDSAAVTGNYVFVGDQEGFRGPSRVEVYDSTGTHQGEFGSGELEQPRGVAIDSANDKAYVVDSRQRTVFKYDLSTTPPSLDTSWGGLGNVRAEDNIAVDSTGSNVYVADTSFGQRHIRVFDSSGTEGTPIGGAEFGGFNEPSAVAVDSADNIYGGSSSGVIKFDSAGNKLATIGSENRPSGLAVDASDNLYVFNGGEVIRYDSAGTEQERFGSGEFGFGSHALAFGATPGIVYATDGGNDRVLMFEEIPPGPPVVGDESSTQVKAETAKLNATVNPTSSAITDCHFEYGTTTSYGTQVPCDPDITGNEGAWPISVSAELTGLSEDTTYHWRIVATNGEGTDTGADQTFTTEKLPTVTVDPVSNITGTSATFSGTVNPEGNPTSYQFEYSSDGFATSSFVPVNPQLVGSDSTDHVVIDDVVGLVPNSDYEVRLIASSPASGTTTSASVAFSTPAVSPEVRYGLATAGKESATIRGIINPNNAETTYFFEWGTDTSYGNRVPVPDASAGDGTEPVIVSEHLTGLDRNTTYHYRLTAENLAGTTQGPAQAVTTTNNAGLTDNRAYEMVTPPDKAGFGAGGTLASDNGDGLAFSSQGAFGDVISAPGVSQYIASRGEDGWTSTNVSPPIDVGGDLNVQGNYQGFNSDLSVAFVTGLTVTPDAPVGVPNLFRQALPDRDFTLVTTERAEPTFGSSIDPSYFPTLAAYSDNASRVFVQTGRNTQLCCDAGIAVYESIPATGQLRPVGIMPDRFQGLETAADGGTFTLTFDGEETAAIAYNASSSDIETALEALPNLTDIEVNGSFNSFVNRGTYWINLGEEFANTDTPSLSADDSNLTGTDTKASADEGILPPGRFTGDVAPTKLGSIKGNRPSDEYPSAVSADGGRAVWGITESRAPQGEQTFLRDTGSTPSRTVEIGLSQGGAHETGEFPTYFETADRSLSQIFFTSEGALTPDANTGSCGFRGCSGTDLYRFDVASGELTDITVLPVGDGAQVLGVVRASDDASRVYFVAQGKFDPAAATGEPNLYLWSDDGSPKGNISYIATLGTGLPDRLLWTPGLRIGDSYATEDGRFFMFNSSKGDLTGVDDVSSGSQVYLFDAEAGIGDPVRLRCISCNPRGEAPIGRSFLGGTHRRVMEARNITDNGQAFFVSEDALVAGDTNNDRDVYQYDIASGQLSLVTTGTPAPSSLAFSFVDASADGSSVFFQTAKPLDVRDVDQVNDVYVARSGGGFPAPPPDTDCQGDECQGDPTAPPESEEFDSTDPSGSGNVDPKAQRCERLVAWFQQLKTRFLRLKVAYFQADTAAERRRIKRRAIRVKRKAIQVRQAAIRCRASL